MEWNMEWIRGGRRVGCGLGIVVRCGRCKYVVGSLGVIFEGLDVSV